MKFNSKPQTAAGELLNYEGEKAFMLTPAMQLYTAVATAGLSDQFYGKADEKLDRIRGLIAKTDAEFVAKLAVYARERMNLRSIPLVLAVELARLHNGDDLVSRLVARVIQRADEITELLAYYTVANNRTGAKRLSKLSRQLQKGLSEAFNKFDEYQLAKYNRNAAITLKDALFIVHPKAKDEAQQTLFDLIVKDELQTPYTWEAELSALGQKEYETDKQRKLAVREKWEELIFSKRLGYMATLRNLRNILGAGVSTEALDKVCGYLADEKAVAGSRQLPFRFLSAYRELKELHSGRTGLVLDALEKAALCTAANIGGYDDDTIVVIAADVSGSMQVPISTNSKILNYDIGLMLAMLLQNRCTNVITGMFGDEWKVIQVPKRNILSGVQEFYGRAGEVGYSTNGYLVVKDLLRRSMVVDKILLFTDCQLWNSNNTGERIDKLWQQYKGIAPRARLYLFDLAGYGRVPLDVLQDDVYLIAGWSDKIFDVLRSIDEGQDALGKINEIEL